MKSSDLTKGGFYNWKNQPERLVYITKMGSWHQFAKVETPNTVWCEVLDQDLSMLEATPKKASDRWLEEVAKSLQGLEPYPDPRTDDGHSDLDVDPTSIGTLRPQAAASREPKPKPAVCPTCQAPCKTEVLMRGGENGWGTTDAERTVYRHEPGLALESGEFAPADELNMKDIVFSVLPPYPPPGAGMLLNKTVSGVMATHTPTGLYVICNTERSQHRNRDLALSMLKTLSRKNAEKPVASGTYTDTQIISILHDALVYHQEQTRPIATTQGAIEVAKKRLGLT